MINIGTPEAPKELSIGSNLSSDNVIRLTKFLKEYQDVFAWSYADMPGLDRSIVEHRLPTDSAIPPKKQKLRRYKPDLILQIKDEVDKLLNVGFIEVAKYPEWVANIVPVIKNFSLHVD